MPHVELVIELLIFAVFLVLAVLGFDAVRKYRGRADNDTLGPGELLLKFREMHLRGDLSDAEFRTLKTVLEARTELELKDSGQTG